MPPGSLPALPRQRRPQAPPAAAAALRPLRALRQRRRPCPTRSPMRCATSCLQRGSACTCRLLHSGACGMPSCCWCLTRHVQCPDGTWAPLVTRNSPSPCKPVTCKPTRCASARGAGLCRAHQRSARDARLGGRRAHASHQACAAVLQLAFPARCDPVPRLCFGGCRARLTAPDILSVNLAGQHHSRLTAGPVRAGSGTGLAPSGCHGSG